METASMSQPIPSEGTTISSGAPLFFSLAPRMSSEMPATRSPLAACTQGADPEWVYAGRGHIEPVPLRERASGVLIAALPMLAHGGAGEIVVLGVAFIGL